MNRSWSYYYNMTKVTQREDAQHTIIEPFEFVEVAKQMKKMQINKACGPDGVHVFVVRWFDVNVVSHLFSRHTKRHACQRTCALFFRGLNDRERGTINYS